jgi:hypothetical protein
MGAKMKRRMMLSMLAAGAATLCVSGLAASQTTNSISKPARTGSAETYSSQEIIDTGHRFFGRTTRGLAEAVEYVFQSKGEPTAYIVGEEGAGAFIGGLRYGEGTIYYKSGGKERIYWQGPSVGFDFGGNGSRTLTLVYNSTSPSDLLDTRFIALEGSAYLVGGLGVSFQQHENILLAPIRTGVGARLGANLGYSKYTNNPDWNPF